eukprot:TRINITY_DN4591_c0_g1_i2.p1 TRINITY_DN4591_c0_g1~~TRINITY_DN4591_c0_g1_i2.p1  ORF type:complete len:392 (+),score=55.08 TRINITY_DN4591_c0_g1_i2:72-1247(+)
MSSTSIRSRKNKASQGRSSTPTKERHNSMEEMVVHTPPRVSVACSIYGLAWNNARGIVYGGGGGKSKTGIPNLLVHAAIDASKGLCTTKARVDPDDAVMALDCHPTQSIIACAVGTDIKLFKLKDNKFTAGQRLGGEAGQNVRVVKFSPDGSYLVGAGEAGFITLYSYPSCKRVGSFSGHSESEPVIDVDFNPRSLLLATVSWDKTVRVWRARAAAKSSTQEPCLQVMKLDEGKFQGYTFRGVRFHPRDANVLFTLQSKSKNSAYVTRWERSKPEGPFEATISGAVHSAPLVSFAISPDGHTLGAGSSEGHVVTVDSTTVQPLTMQLQHSFFVSSLAFSPDSLLLATSGGDQQLRFLPVSTAPAGDLRGLVLVVAIILALVMSFLWLFLLG